MHNIDICCTAHESNPDEKWAQDVEGVDPQVLCVQEKKNKVDALEEGEDPNFLDFDKFKRTSGHEDSDLVAIIQNNIKFFDLEFFAIRIICLNFYLHSVGKARDNRVLKNIDRKQIDNQENDFG